MPHHGSRYQDLAADFGARIAVVSVGADNDYGHPAEATLTTSSLMVRGYCAPTATVTSSWPSGTVDWWS